MTGAAQPPPLRPPARTVFRPPPPPTPLPPLPPPTPPTPPFSLRLPSRLVMSLKFCSFPFSLSYYPKAGGKSGTQCECEDLAPLPPPPKVSDNPPDRGGSGGGAGGETGVSSAGLQRSRAGRTRAPCEGWRSSRRGSKGCVCDTDVKLNYLKKKKEE